MIPWIKDSKKVKTEEKRTYDLQNDDKQEKLENGAQIQNRQKFDMD